MVLDVLVAHISRVQTIAAEPQVIWDVLADFGSISTWADFVDHSCLLGPAAGVGQTGLTRRVQLGRNTVVERIVEFDPPRRIAYHVEGLPRLVRRLRNQWELHAAAGGATAVTLTSTVDIGPHLPQRCAERVLCRVVATQSDQLLAGLAHHVEACSV